LVRQVADRLDVPTDYIVSRLAGRAAPRPERAGVSSRPSPGADSLASERALLAMCLAAGDLGKDYLARLREGHFSTDTGRRARDHLADHFEDPLADLPEEDPALAELVTGAAMEAVDQEAVAEPVLRMSYLQLELRRVDRELRRASEQADRARQDELSGARQDVRREMDAVMGQTA
jgi:hypothetical protein